MDEPPVFLLSPARCDGRRAAVLFSPAASFELAMRLRAAPQPIGEIFAFLSGLYFRGKLAYAAAFGRHDAKDPGIFVITANRGLLTPEATVSLEELQRFAGVDLADAGTGFRDTLRRDATAIRERISDRRCVVLLGSIATGKYADILVEVFGERLLFPSDFVGRGDMSRGGLMLRQVREGRELPYAAVRGAVRRGKRPPKLR